MALGFGFNKAKVLASAEKYVQQNKLNNAIAEYEKIVEKDPKDLTVLNTIGDLYARVGQTEKAGEFFRKVGDSYASDGFTVKAIAMYKKLTKLNPGAISVVQRLAELYTQQGLHNDARQQYLILADNYVKNHDLPNATRIFQKMLEMDPYNISLQSKLADLHLKSGKKDEARDIFLQAANSLYERSSIDQAGQSIDKVLEIDPNNVDALLLRAKIALDNSNGTVAAQCLEKVPDIDQRPDGLKSLLRAYILGNDAEHAEGVARKMATVHNDLSGVRVFSEYLVAGSKAEQALKIFDEFIDRLVVGDTGELTFALQGLSGHLKEDVGSLERLRNVLQRAGATASIPEVNEMLAHAYVKANKLAPARELYKELADLEPSNPQHMQNYRQVVARMGEDPAAKSLEGGEASQALFVEEIVDTPIPPVPDYPAALMEKISNVLTDAELFESYNKPQQAIAPLEAILEKAPNDVRVNQRLLSVYSKVERLADAAARCDVLNTVYQQAGMSAEAQQYAEMAAQLRQQAGVPQPQAAAMPVEMPVVAPAVHEMPVEAPSAPVGEGEAHEIDLSSEWESALQEMPVDAGVTGSIGTAEFSAKAGATEEEVHPSVVSDLLEEIEFYIGQQMWTEASSAISRCETAAPANARLVDLKARLQAAQSGAAVSEAKVPESPAEEGTVVEYDFDAAMAEPVVQASSSALAVEPPVQPAPIEMMPVASAQEMELAPAESYSAELMQPEPEPEPVPAAEEKIEEEIPVTTPEPEPVAVVAQAKESERDVLTDMVFDLESALPEDFGGPAKVIPMPEPAPKAAAAVASTAVAAPAPMMTEVAVSSLMPEMVASASTAVGLAPAVEANTMLSDLFEEFKEDVGEAAEEREDPDTHYNLGVAFKEMGLLDEAIGELQKVCKAIDNGAQFSQVMQAYTWLANCFVEKGVPEASVKWYEKALKISDSEESRTALHYDLANAFEAAGDRVEALKHFTEVYGTNIDYRDVAERIKALKS
jgi:tetratricopeptide (TPR) repeat protein